MHAKHIEKSKKRREVSKINLSVTHNAKNRSLFFRNVFFLFLGKGMTCMHRNIAYLLREPRNLSSLA